MSATFTRTSRLGPLAVALGLVGLLLSGAAGPAVGPTAPAFAQAPGAAPDAQQTPTLLRSERDGRAELLVRTKLAEYVFGEDGALRSAYLHFAPVGLAPVELIPDTETGPGVDPETGARARRYAPEARFPFALRGELNGQRLDGLRYAVESERLDGRLRLRFTAQINGLRLTKTFVLWDNPHYTLEVELALENVSSAPLELDQLGLSLGRGVGRRPDLQRQVRYLVDGRVTTEPPDASASASTSAGRVGLEGLGFVGDGLVFFLKLKSKPKPKAPGLPASAPLGRPSAQGGELVLGLPARTLAPGEARRYAFEVYAGRAKYPLLKAVGLGALAPPGFFSSLVVPVVELLNWLYRRTGNYGYAIILFTLLVRVLLFPLMRQQFHAMAKLARLRPKLEKLQQRYPTYRRLKELHPDWSPEELMRRHRENQQALQQKLMELYREEGVNPLGGCLPLLIQFPILIILWQAILQSAELIHLSPGFLWMPDLSLHDPYYLIVALTALAMILQTKTTPTLTPSSQGPSPLILTLFSVGLMVVFLKDFPSGLWLYYFLTTILQVGQQVFIGWELERLQAQTGKADGGGRPAPGPSKPERP